MTIAAEYYNIPASTKRANPGKAGQVQIVSLLNGRREVGHTTLVASKAEAREVAAVFRAIPWNF